jgi:pyridoxamine 5'-phosphate oxidase
MTHPYLAPTLPDELPDNPMAWAEAWLLEATAQSVQRNPNSMMLVTVASNGQPSARVVLCKSFLSDPGYVVFYTNYKSRKIEDLVSRPDVAATFHWDALGRQIRLEGIAVKSPESESDEYFASRDWGSQIGAWGSDQSAPLESRQALREQVRDRARALGVEVTDDLQSLDGDQKPTIARPPHWGGVRIWPARIELWIEGADRVHDRAVWTRDLTRDGESDFDASAWTGKRLQP